MTYFVAVGLCGFAVVSAFLMPAAMDCSRKERFDLDADVALLARYLEKLSFV